MEWSTADIIFIILFGLILLSGIGSFFVEIIEEDGTDGDPLL